MNKITIVIAIVAIFISSYTLINRDPMAEPVTGNDAKEVAKNMLMRPRWDGTSSFFRMNKSEILSNIEISNILENNGVGIAFVRTSASGKKLQFCIWMRKNDSTWEWVPYLSQHLKDDLRRKWVSDNQKWLEDMEEKKRIWEEASDSVW